MHNQETKLNMTKDIRIDLHPNIWGGSGWLFSDAICLSYPSNPTDDEKQHYKNFFHAYPIILPCNKCRLHFNQYLKRNPLNDKILSSKDKLINWILGARNNVNQINGKKEIKIEEFYKFYNDKFKIDVRNDTCTNTCGLKQNSNKVSKEIYNYKFLSIVLFGIIISLSLYLIRSNQINNF